MASDLTSGFLTLAGTVVGGLITFGGTYRTASVQRRQVEQARREQIADARRQTQVSFLTKLDTFLDHARELVLAMDGNDDGAPLRDLHKRYADEWLDFISTNAAVQIAGPKLVAERADALTKAVGTYSDAIDDRYLRGKWGRGREDAWDSVARARNAFLAATQDDYEV
ncbi:hypothetical protein O7598_10640 [Micromonospora sp. WMMC241]|uniref:hypothetical protein n=1 Tax=Micromonospora sp. WMMC241 TaxID=3015159 RepID=UPI0022B73FCE|nr:hypothetical protein [Micromonospora sp. WMMC241]MCZ7436850.1 hypothetical protein [Micromonospora sp. WMMC241]